MTAAAKFPTAEPIVGGAAISAPPRLTDDASATASRDAAVASGYVELDSGYAALNERLALAEFDAAVPPPIDRDNPVDAEMFRKEIELRARANVKRTELENEKSLLGKREEELAEHEPPTSRTRRSLRAVFVMLVLVVAASVIGSLLAGGLDLFLHRQYLTEVFGKSTGKQLSAAAGAIVAILAALLILGIPTLGAYISRGMVPLFLKITAWVGKLGFATTFTLIRMKGGAFTESISAGVLEVTLFVAVSAVPYVLANRLRVESTDKLAWRKDRRLRDLAAARVARLEKELNAAEAAHAAQWREIEQRDLADRKSRAWRELVAATRLHAYVTAVAGAQTEAARASDTLHTEFVEAVREHITNEKQRATARREG